MRLPPLRIRGAAVALGCLCFAPPFLSPGYSAKIEFTEIDVPGAAYTWASAINNHSEVIGGYADQSNVAHSFLRTADGTITTFDVPGSGSAGASSINDHGDITGSFGYPDAGFLRHADGKFETFTNRKSVDPTAMNEHREIVGILANNRYKRQGFLREEHSNLSLLPDMGSKFVYVSGINNSGTIVWSTADDNGSRGFIRSADGTITQVQAVPGARYTDLAAINESGWIAGNSDGRGFLRDPEGQTTIFDHSALGAYSLAVTCLSNTNWIGGNYDRGDGIYHGFVRRPDGTLITVDDPNAVVGGLAQLLGINAQGLVTGYYTDANNVTHGYIASVR
jgi:uncharacterized membrane protein